MNPDEVLAAVTVHDDAWPRTHLHILAEGIVQRDLVRRGIPIERDEWLAWLVRALRASVPIEEWAERLAEAHGAVMRHDAKQDAT